MEFGQPVSQNLVREFQEETGLVVQVGEFRFVCEFIQVPLHAIELFFQVTVLEGRLAPGSDPEMDKHKQIINSVEFLSIPKIMALPEGHRHGSKEVLLFLK